MATFSKKIILVSLALILFPGLVHAASLSVVPSSGTYEVGDTVSVQIVVSGDTSLNAVSGKVSISPNFFSIQSISKSGSVLNFWVTEPSFDRALGIANFEGVSLTGFQGFSGNVATIKLKALRAGTGKISFQTAQILANDGQGTDITGSVSGGTFTITPATEKTAPVKQPTEEKGEEKSEEVSQPLPSLKAPEIVAGTKYGELSIVGSSSYPKAQVLITFVAEGGAKIFITGQADDDGSFNITVPNSLKHGQYSVSAVMIKNDKSNSEKSNTILITVGTIFSDLSKEVMWLIGLLVLAIFYLLLRTYHHVTGSKSIRSRVKPQTEHAEEIAHKSFDILREDVLNYKNEHTSTIDNKMVSDMKKDIDAAEKVVEKEIKDIGSV